MGAFTILPYNYCNLDDIPAFQVDQDCTNYPQRLAQICGLICLPNGATGPEDWTTIEGWQSVIDNTDTANTKAKYLTGIGSFLPVSEPVISLSGGRHESYGERRWRCALNVLNMFEGHVNFGRQIQGGYRDFSVWIETVGGRLIGGQYGLTPFLTNAVIPFEANDSATERMELSVDFFFPAVP